MAVAPTRIVEAAARIARYGGHHREGPFSQPPTPSEETWPRSQRRPIYPTTISTLCCEQVHCAVYRPARRRQSPPYVERRDARRRNSLWLPKRSRSSVSSALNLEEGAKCDCIHVIPTYSIRDYPVLCGSHPLAEAIRPDRIARAVRAPFKIVCSRKNRQNGQRTRPRP